MLNKDQIDYPIDVFNALIDGNSPYAFYLFQWVPYQTDAKKWRLKMCHDVRTFDGREAHGIWPNGDHCGPFRDDEVEFIRISKKQLCIEWRDPRLPQQGYSTKPTEGGLVRRHCGRYFLTQHRPSPSPPTSTRCMKRGRWSVSGWQSSMRRGMAQINLYLVGSAKKPPPTVRERKGNEQVSRSV